jgi:hypothetical protein
VITTHSFFLQSADFVASSNIFFGGVKIVRGSEIEVLNFSNLIIAIPMNLKNSFQETVVGISCQ